LYNILFYIPLQAYTNSIASDNDFSTTWRKCGESKDASPYRRLWARRDSNRTPWFVARCGGYHIPMEPALQTRMKQSRSHPVVDLSPHAVARDFLPFLYVQGSVKKKASTGKRRTHSSYNMCGNIQSIQQKVQDVCEEEKMA
jgi:hypothetical protein